ncbi:MAG TPA: hypothetical protein VEY14_02775 [Nocardioidaceae bacterium]|nr:hypothetical protein [Nocardioidaceae bacterium]
MAQTRLWHVTLTVAGDSIDPAELKRALRRLAAQHGFLHSLRYADSCAEVTYWEEAGSMLDAAAMAMRLWDEHRQSADLPPWKVAGLEILEQSVIAVRSNGLRSDSGGPRLGSRTPQPVRF